MRVTVWRTLSLNWFKLWRRTTIPNIVSFSLERHFRTIFPNCGLCSTSSFLEFSTLLSLSMSGSIHHLQTQGPETRLNSMKKRRFLLFVVCIRCSVHSCSGVWRRMLRVNCRIKLRKLSRYAWVRCSRNYTSRWRSPRWLPVEKRQKGWFLCLVSYWIKIADTFWT